MYIIINHIKQKNIKLKPKLLIYKNKLKTLIKKPNKIGIDPIDKNNKDKNIVITQQLKKEKNIQFKKK